ncbi:endonuclease/exonuclease/phosphatase family protein [Streptosporangium amethystogenes]|uniref:endonuclease/exonuclease/phosphatase family protein n=1 Tax=Streptosporangium amethystogenes TaxID=2002 RepID=UPI0037A65106
MITRKLMATAAALVVVTVPLSARQAQARTLSSAISVMSWNVCAGTNPGCFFYGRNMREVAVQVGRYATTQPIKPDVIFLQEFCSGGTATLESLLEQQTRRAWTVRSSILTLKDGSPKVCAPDRQGFSRGDIAVTVAVADNAVTFQAHGLTSPPWYAKRMALCAAIPAKRVNVCGTHLSSGLSYDDREPGAPFRTKQVGELLAAAARPGYRAVFGGDLNLAPPDSGQSTAAKRRILAPVYAAYAECDQNGGRDGRWTEKHVREDGGVVKRKLDYLFAPRGSVTRCHVAQDAASSDHKPIYVKVDLGYRG